jgi:hypothetical protein
MRLLAALLVWLGTLAKLTQEAWHAVTSVSNILQLGVLNGAVA